MKKIIPEVGDACTSLFWCLKWKCLDESAAKTLQLLNRKHQQEKWCANNTGIAQECLANVKNKGQRWNLVLAALFLESEWFTPVLTGLALNFEPCAFYHPCFCCKICHWLSFMAQRRSKFLFTENILDVALTSLYKKTVPFFFLLALCLWEIRIAVSSFPKSKYKSTPCPPAFQIYHQA